MMGAQFPGHVWGPEAEPLTAEAPPLTAAVVAAYPCTVAVIAQELDGEDEIDAGLVWALQPGTMFADLPTAWVSRAVQLLNDGGAVLLLAHDDTTERAVRAGLLDALDLREMPAHRMARA